MCRRWEAALWAWVGPHIDLTETDKELTLKTELPGMDERDVDLLVEDGMLTLKGDKRSETGDKERQVSERYYRRFRSLIDCDSKLSFGGSVERFGRPDPARGPMGQDIAAHHRR